MGEIKTVTTHKKAGFALLVNAVLKNYVRIETNVFSQLYLKFIFRCGCK